MGNYKIKMNIGILSETEDMSQIVSVESEGIMTEAEAESIDAVEKALLNVNKEVLVKSISTHLEEISKKKLKRD